VSKRKQFQISQCPHNNESPTLSYDPPRNKELLWQ
jgi:hypothetical protein